MKKQIKRFLSFALVALMLCVPLQFTASAATARTKLVTSIPNETSVGNISFNNHTYQIYNSVDNQMVSTGLMLGKSVGDFVWELDYATNNNAWCVDTFRFHCENGGNSDWGAYLVQIKGSGSDTDGNHTISICAGAANEVIASTYYPFYLDWQVLYHLKIQVVGNHCTASFYPVSDPTNVATVETDLDVPGYPAAGDFKIQGWNSQLFVKNMSIVSDSTTYVFDPDDVPTYKLATLTKNAGTGTITFANNEYVFNGNGNDEISTGMILNENIGDFVWEFDYGSTTNWQVDRFIFHCAEGGNSLGGSYIVTVNGANREAESNKITLSTGWDGIDTYVSSSNIGVLPWDMYHVKIQVKDCHCKVWFYPVGSPSTEPILEGDVKIPGYPSAGDFKLQGYNSAMVVKNMSIISGNTTYVFDPADVPVIPEGDITFDYKVDSADLALMRQVILGQEIVDQYDFKYFDLNDDKAINLLDLVRIKKILAQ